MKNLLNPKWIFIINTLPVLVLMIIGFQEFFVIKTLLSAETIWEWKNHAFWLLAFGLINFGFSLFLVLKKRKIRADFALFMLLSTIAFIYSYYSNIDKIIPSSIPNWMLSGETMFYVGTFLMPTLAYSLFIIVFHFTPKDKKVSPWLNFAYALLVTLTWYIFAQLILPLWKNIDTDFNVHFLIIASISGVLIFLFFLIRGLYILMQNKSKFLQKYQLVWKIIFSLILPIIGLLVNNGVFKNSDFHTNSFGIFGDFNSLWFYFLTVFNAIVLCIPNFKNKKYRLFQFLFRAFTFAFTFYFFLVFLPFLPLSVIAIVAIGFGFLMLSPLILFLFHSFQLAEDYAFLKNYFSNHLLTTTSTVAFLIIPTVITLKYLNDKRILTKTLEFVYTPNYSKNYNINLNSLENTLKIVKSYKNKRGDFLESGKIPYLSSYFNWLVLDNLTLSDAKISKIEKIFFGKSEIVLFDNNPPKDSIKIKDISTKTTFDTKQRTYKTWINFDLKDEEKHSGNHEFSTEFNIPDGCFISNYYLEVNGKKEFGILAEKKSAMWIYSQIRNYQKDPGILNYLTGNRISFRVFPFTNNETRKTGIEFMHKEPLKLNIENQEIQLGNVSDTHRNSSFENKDIKYISTAEKQNIKPVFRTPYLCFLIDDSQGKEKQTAALLKRVKKFKSEYPEYAKNSQNGYVDYDLKQSLYTKSTEYKGGFNLDRAIKKLLIKNYNSGEFPVFIVVTDSLQNAILESNYADLRFTFPDNDLYYNLKSDGNLQSFSLSQNSKKLIENNAIFNFNQSVIPYKIASKTYYLENNNLPSLILKSDHFTISNNDIKEGSWNSGLLMQGQFMAQTLHPELKEKEWLNSVKNSFKSKIMTPYTSYLVVENEAQKLVLKRKQEQVLNGNISLDTDEETQSMPEPNLIIIGVLIVLFIAFKEYKNKKLQPKNLKC
ncbi:MSEP-CTERM protein [Halpernia humi]|uniref:MSEP-CTERM protein n=1 Tax=Halpernia humi TaxID=493375 RepID=A0A1H5WHA2_9FLAO|nr:MSEP-CTERM sorting domain-containing protein [Halpernia humi]SEF98842.1 MSEP-CTERM protein [Halpernia humi]